MHTKFFKVTVRLVAYISDGGLSHPRATERQITFKNHSCMNQSREY